MRRSSMTQERIPARCPNLRHTPAFESASTKDGQFTQSPARTRTRCADGNNNLRIRHRKPVSLPRSMSGTDNRTGPKYADDIVVRMFRVGNEEHITDKRIQPLTQSRILGRRLPGKSRFHLTLRVLLGLQRIPIHAQSIQINGLHFLGTFTEQFIQYPITDIGMGKIIFPEPQSPLALDPSTLIGSEGKKCPSRPCTESDGISHIRRIPARGRYDRH